MDPLAHTLTGIALANAGFRQRIGRGAILGLILASNVTDVDIFGTFFLSEPSWTYRRMWTHSLLTAPLVVILTAFIFSRYFRNAGFRLWCMAFTVGAAFHILMDLINSYGVVLLFPFSMQRFELSWVFIIDPYIWGLLLLALLLPRVRTSVTVQSAARFGLTALLGYLSLCGGLQYYSSQLLTNEIGRNYPSATFSYVFPEPFGPWRFRGVLRVDNEYRTYLIHPLNGTTQYVRSYRTEERDPSVAALIETEAGRLYQWFFKAPVWSKEEADLALVTDLRFRTILLDRGAPFTYRVGPGIPLGDEVQTP